MVPHYKYSMISSKYEGPYIKHKQFTRMSLPYVTGFHRVLHGASPGRLIMGLNGYRKISYYKAS